MADTAALDFERVTRIFCDGLVETTAVRDVSLLIEPGTLVAITGPSGSGKSTLLHLAAGLIAPTSGCARVGGRDVGSMSRTQAALLRRTAVGLVMQRYNLVPSLTVVENVMLPLELTGVSRRVARRRAADALEAVGIEPPYDRFPDDLSGGQQQRVAIARALAAPRALVLADEPTGALDTNTGDAVMEILVDLTRTGTAVVAVTHDPRVAAFADRVVGLRDGRVVSDSAAVMSRSRAALVGR